MESNPKMIEFDRKCAEFTKTSIIEKNIDESVNKLLKRLKSKNINTIKELDDIIQEKGNELFETYKKGCQNFLGEIRGISLGMALYQIDYL